MAYTVISPVIPPEPEGENKKNQVISAIPINLGDAGSLSLSKSAANYKFKDNNTIWNINIGLESNSKKAGAVGVQAANLLNEATALGMQLMLSPSKSEMVLGTAVKLKSLDLQVRGALSYMRGRQDFSFFRSTETASLSQLAYYGELSWVSPEESDNGLQSVGFSFWGAKAKNHSEFSKKTYIDETNEYYEITTDRRLIAVGNLHGASVNLQYAPGLNLVLNADVGGEQVKFPFSDGSTEAKSSVFFDGKATYQVSDENTIGLGYKKGVTEQSIRIEWKNKKYTVAAFKSIGRDGMAGSYGVNFNVDILSLLGKKSSSSSQALASSMRPKAGNDQQLLQLVMTRPSQLPSNFLAKVDPTALSTVKIDKSNLPPGSTIDADGNLSIPVGEGQGKIYTTHVNGTATNGSSFISMQVNKLIVSIPKLAMPAVQDNYLVDIEDGVGQHFAVTFSTTKE